MPTIIDMPKLSDTMTEGTVAAWLKNEGDRIESGDVIAEIETDKATMELEAFEEGVLIKQIASVGTPIAVGAPIAAVGDEGEEYEAPEETEADPAAAAPVSAEPDLPGENPAAPETEGQDPQEGDSKRDPARIKASPLARKLAAQKGLDLSAITGTGPNGRIVKKDVLAAESGASESPAANSQRDENAGIAAPEDIPVSQMRSVIARRLQESKHNAPHFYLESEVDVGQLLDLRKQLNAELEEIDGLKLSVNDFILKAATEALRRVPTMNRSWNGDSIRQHASVDISFGVAVEDGLLTPVIRNADAKSLKSIALEAKSLIGKARSKKLAPNEMTGSTFTVTNLGMYGVTGFYGIINTPNAGILSVGSTIPRPIVKDDGSIGSAQIMKIGLSCDHRVVDGVVGAQFLQALKKIIESPALLLL